MKDLIRKVLNEEVNRLYRRPSPSVIIGINKMIDNFFKKTTIQFKSPSLTYGVYTAKFTINGQLKVLFSGYNGSDDDEDEDEYEENSPTSARILVDNELVDTIKSLFKVRESLILNYITEYIEDNYLDMIEKEYGVEFYEIDSADKTSFREDTYNF
jgi:hypothetical protein